MHIRRLLIISIFLFSVIFVPKPVLAESINSFNADIAVHTDGSIGVQETIIYDFATRVSHGILRTIPFLKTNTSGDRFKLDIRVQSVVDEAQRAYQYSTSQGNNNLILKIGDPQETIIGTHTYIISYEVRGAITYFSDHDELYWNVTGNRWQVPIESAQAHIQIPSTATENALEGMCYTGIQGSTNNDCLVNYDTQGASYETSLPLFPGQGFTIVASFPKGLVAVLEPQADVPFSESLWGTILIGFILCGLVWWALLYPIQIAVKWFLYGRDPNVGTEVSSWFDPPQGSGNRPLTPAETGSLIDETVDTRDILATVVQIAQRGYITIEERKKNDFYFIKVAQTSKTDILLPFEQTLFNKFFATKDEFRVKGSYLASTITKVENQLYESLLQENFFVKNPQKTRNFYTIIAGLAFITMNPLLVLSALIFGRHMPRKTVLGAQKASIGKSLKNFLVSQERTLVYQAQTQTLFEKLLPYAIAFGVEKVWAQRFKDIPMQQPDWYNGYDHTNFSSAYLSRSLGSSLATLQNAATPRQSSSGFSSGSHFGFSGGGGGGGGGGSW